MDAKVESSKPEYLGAKAKIRLPDVDEALDKGHAIHGADDPDLAGTYSQELARRIVKDFFAVRATPGTPEEPYLSAMHDVARGFGRALTREKRLWVEQIKAAEAERERRDKQIRTRWEGQGIGIMWKFLWPVILGLSGFLFAQVLGVTVLEDVADKTGTSIPSIITTLAFVLAGRMISRWWYDRRRDKISNMCDARLYLAEQAYELAKLREFKHWRQKGVEAWEQYTNGQYPERASYQMVMEADMATRRKVQEHLILHNKTDIERLQEIIKYCGSLIFRRRKKSSLAPVE